MRYAVTTYIDLELTAIKVGRMVLALQKVTTEILWKAAVFFALVDVFYVAALVRRIDGKTFRGLRCALIGTTGVFWFFLWLLMVAVYWEAVYHYVFPAWARWLIPPVYGLLFALVAHLFWWLSLHLAGWPTLTFCLLGGLWGMVTHLWGVSRGLIENPPMLQGVSVMSVAVMPVFEFIFYWCVSLTIALFLYRRRNRLP